MADYGNPGWAGVLGAALSGGAGQLAQIKQQRDQEIARQLQERQLQEQQEQNDIDLFFQKLDAIPPDADVDEDTLKQGASLGLAGIFQKDPTSGGFRRIKTVSDRVNDLELDTATVTNQRTKYEFGRFQEAQDPQLFAKLQTQYPDPNVRRFVAEQVYGIKADPITTDEDRAQKKFEAQNAASVYAAQMRGMYGSGGGGAGSLEGLEGVVEMVQKNPALFAQLNPTLKGRILQAFPHFGKEFPNQSQDQTLALAARGKMLLSQMQGDQAGLQSRVGMPSLSDRGGWLRLFSDDAPVAPGSDAARFGQYLERFRAVMTVPELQHMRGLGHLSEREFETMKNLGTALSGNMDEEAFKDEMDLAYQILEQMEDRASRGYRVTDQNDIFKQMEQGIIKGRREREQPGYRQVNGKIYGQ
jgi:hypothetical protein